MQKIHFVICVLVLAVFAYSAPTVTHAALIYTSPAGNVNGTITPDLASFWTSPPIGPTMAISLSFNPTVGGNGGVVVDELGSGGYASGWHDSQIEVESNGQVLASVWPYSSTINLGTATFGLNNSVYFTYNAATGSLAGSLNGVAATPIAFGARQSAFANTGGQFYAFGAGDVTNHGNGQSFVGSISNVQIFNTPEPSSLILCGLAAVGLLVAYRRKA